MPRLSTIFWKLWRDESATTAIEYGVIGLVVSVTIVVSVTTIGSKISNKWIGALAGNM